MPYVMKLETWLDQTNAGMLKPRSSKLKMLDKAIKEHQANPSDHNLAVLKAALHGWKMSKGYDAVGGKPAWMTSDRNTKGAVSTLDQQIFGITPLAAKTVLADLAELPFFGLEALAEAEAREVMKKARDEALNDLFRGRTLDLKKANVALFGYGVKRDLARAKKGATDTASALAAPLKEAAKSTAMKVAQPAIDAARELIMGILDDLPLDIVREIMRMLDEIIPNFLQELAGAITPYIGVVRSGAKTTSYLVKTIKARYDLYDMGKHQVGILAGNPAAASHALLELIRRKVQENLAITGVYATDTAIKGGSLALDAASLGIPSVSAVATPLSGMMTSLTLLGIKIRLLARDLQERRKANLLLARPSLDAQLFRECPLLGCWFLACANTSDVANFLISDIGQTGWKIDVEVTIRQHVHPIIESARDFIADSRFEVSGLAMSKGASANTLAYKGLNKANLKKKMMAGLGKIAPSLDNQNYQQFALKQGHKAVDKTTLKSRIVGFGSG